MVGGEEKEKVIEPHPNPPQKGDSLPQTPSERGGLKKEASNPTTVE
jgi:hypothetical protein